MTVMKMIWKKIMLSLLSLSVLCACTSNNVPNSNNTESNYTYKCDASGKCNGQFMGPFDTIFQVIMYVDDEKQYQEAMELIEDRFTYYNALFDKYNDYENVNNVKTINDNAGIEPVKVDYALYALIEDGIAYNQRYSDKVNIAFGPVLEIWHEYRENNDGSVPTLEELEEKNAYTDISKIVLDKENKTVYLTEAGMSLDVGATAKGYACELVKRELISQGIDDFLISAGGNVVSYGKRAVQASETSLSDVLPACRDYYTIDIQSPQDGAYADIKAIAAIIIDGKSAVTSGDYQRYYIGDDGVYYHHLVDPETLFPPHYFRSVTIVCDDSGLADFLSSATFLLPYEKGRELIDSIAGVEAVWLLNDGTISHTDGLIEGENCHFYAQLAQ